MHRKLILVLLILVLSINVSDAVVLDSSIIFSNFVDVPDTTVTYDSYVCDIDNLGSYQVNQVIQANIKTDPSFDTIQVQLVDKNQNQIWVQNTPLSGGTAAVTIPGQSTASTYGVVLVYNGEYKGAKPVVISEYTMTLTLDKTRVSPGERLGIKITTQKNSVPADTPDQVRTILFQGSTSLSEVTAARTGTGTYETAITMPTIPGTYSVYGGIATSDYIMAYPELVGITDGGDVTVIRSADSGGSSPVGAASEEDFGNIVLREIDRRYTGANKSVSYAFEKPGNVITFVNLTSKVNYGDIDTVVEILMGTSTLVGSDPPGIVYKNVNIWAGKAGWASDRTVADSSVSFKVAKQWIEDEEIDENSIYLLQYEAGKWNYLTTTATYEDNAYKYFTAQTPGFTTFAISGSRKEPAQGGAVKPDNTTDPGSNPAAADPTPYLEFRLLFGIVVSGSIIAVILHMFKK